MEKKAFENIMGKRENAGNQHFLLFPTMFSTLPSTLLFGKDTMFSTLPSTLLFGKDTMFSTLPSILFFSKE